MSALPGGQVPGGAAEATGAAPQDGDAGAGSGWDRRIAGGLAFLRRRLTGDYDVDEFGYDKELTDQVLMSVLRPLADKYFRVEVKGIENIPSDGVRSSWPTTPGRCRWTG